ncbi:hypothetical protein Taro_001926 [Colocasia esculenta]|uniref:ENT domain-containing protein n=1 Tax=Colocasia esculenta TaxID=4460 RepID=A0A843TBE8_COLES|nr:hypothetical protein [Colocasia esculenta]
MRGGRVTGNGRSSMMGTLPYTRVHTDMETEIHQLEQEAYCSVLRAFKAQSDAITWEKEGLITELRKELRVSDEEHRELLTRVNADDIIRKIREWRRAGGPQAGFIGNAQPVPDTIPSPTVSASRKKQKTSQPIPSSSLGATTSALHPQAVAVSMQPSSSAAKRGAASVSARGKKSKSGQALPMASSAKSAQYPSAVPPGRAQLANRIVGGTEPTSFDPLIGRKVWTRWPADNNFYEAVITDYNPAEGLHALVYDINTKDETWEWVNLKEISPEDLHWDGEDPGIITHQVGRGGPPGRGVKKTGGRGGAVAGAGRGRGALKNQSKKDFPPSQNGIGRKGSDDIEILDTESLIKEVERVFGSSHPDPSEMEKMKKTLKEHEQSLIDAIARLADASDGESDGEHQSSHGQRMDWRNKHMANYEDNMMGVRREGSDGGGMPLDYRQDGDDEI